MVKMHSTVVTADNEIIPRRIDENNSLGSIYALTELAVATNVITVTGKTHYVGSTGSTETVKTIAGGVKGQNIKLFAATGVTVTVDETDNIKIVGSTGVTAVITGDQHLEVMFDGTNYIDVGGYYT